MNIRNNDINHARFSDLLNRENTDAQISIYAKSYATRIENINVSEKYNPLKDETLACIDHNNKMGIPLNLYICSTEI